MLDWTNARAGDPRADYARTLTILRLDSGTDSPLGLSVLRVFEAGWRSGYRRIMGRTSDMAPYYAWAGAVMPATGAKAGSSGRHDGSRTGTRPGMDRSGGGSGRNAAGNGQAGFGLLGARMLAAGQLSRATSQRRRPCFTKTPTEPRVYGGVCIDARKLGEMEGRTHRRLPDADIGRISDTTTPGAARRNFGEPAELGLLC